MSAVSSTAGCNSEKIERFDVIIVGAGISGIGSATLLRKHCPDLNFVVLDAMESFGGTWLMHKYPGTRSDSDLFTFGYGFKPWKGDPIASRQQILDYLGGAIEDANLGPYIRYGHKVQSAAWSSEAASWTLEVERSDAENPVHLQGRFLWMCQGYYRHSQGYTPDWPGLDQFKGQVVHPQHWPNDLNLSGKQVTVIGSGATAATLTMLQRTPTWMVSRPARDGFNKLLRRFLPEKLAYALTRAKNIFMQDLMFKRARGAPEKVKDYLTAQLKAHLGDNYSAADFTPPYDPWDQRLCLVPDADFFSAINQGKASVVTDQIDSFDAKGIKLKSGKHLDADIIVTATGLRMTFAGKINVAVDGKPVDFGQTYFYRNCMFSNVPNMAGVFGYLNASWTLRVDIIAEYLTRLFKQMDAIGAVAATPAMAPGEEPEVDDIFDFSSGYIQRGKHLMPRNAHALPWRLNQEYRKDRIDMRQAPIDDGVLHFTRARELVD